MFASILTIYDVYIDPSNATQSVFGSLDEYVSLPDLATFQVNFGLSSKKISVHSGHSLNVPCSGNRSCFEASLDVQYITAMSPNSETTYWYVDTNVSSIYLTYLIELLELTEPPMVNSMSYGIVEQVKI